MNVFDLIRQNSQSVRSVQTYGEILEGKSRFNLSHDEKEIYDSIKQSDLNRLRKFG